MPARFQGDGLQFAYPENWTLEEQRTEAGRSITVQSPGTAFVFITLDRNRPEVQDVLDTTLATLRDDYPELESKEVSERIAKRPARGYDIEFFSLDWVNSCWVRAFRTATQTILIMCQVTDIELPDAEPVLRAVLASMELTDS